MTNMRLLIPITDVLLEPAIELDMRDEYDTVSAISLIASSGMYG